jgi:hypothetical protein
MYRADDNILLLAGWPPEPPPALDLCSATIWVRSRASILIVAPQTFSRNPHHTLHDP